MGIYVINKYIYMWPGGKSSPDSLTNMTGDVLSGVVGWLSAYYLDKLSKNSIILLFYLKILSLKRGYTIDRGNKGRLWR